MRPARLHCARDPIGRPGFCEPLRLAKHLEHGLDDLKQWAALVQQAARVSRSRSEGLPIVFEGVNSSSATLVNTGRF